MATSCWYLNLSPLQEPFDVGLDEAGRAQCGFNIVARKRPSGTFVQELLAVLEAAGVGTEKANLFGTSAATIPSGAGPFLSIRPTGGVAPEGTHNHGIGAYRRPGAQILVRAETYAAAEGMALAAYAALIGIRNQELSA